MIETIGPRQRDGEGIRIKQGHVGALSELRTGRMPSIPDVYEGTIDRCPERPVGVARERQLLGR